MMYEKNSKEIVRRKENRTWEIKSRSLIDILHRNIHGKSSSFN